MCIVTSHVVLSLLLMTDGDMAVLQHYYFMYAPLCSIGMYGNDVVILFQGVEDTSAVCAAYCLEASLPA